jgi:hypothetical protein
LTKFLNGGAIKTGIDALAAGVEKWSGTLSKPEFIKSIETFASDMGTLGDAVHWAVGAAKDPEQGAERLIAWDFRGGLPGWALGKLAHLANPTGTDAYQQAAQAAEGTFGLPKGLLMRVAQVESGMNPDAVNPRSGAQGLMQFMPGTAAQYNIDPFNPLASIGGAGQFFADLQKHYKGNLAEELAAYNWGQGNVDAAIKKRGKDWGQLAPEETREYVYKITGTDIYLHNQTGGNTVVSAAALQ